MNYCLVTASYFRDYKLKSPIRRIGLLFSAVPNLFGGRNDGHRAALLFTLDGEEDGAVFQREQGVILAATDVVATVSPARTSKSTP